MSQPPPIKEFKCVSPDEIDIINAPRDSRFEYNLEVDLEYPEELRDEHNLYSLALYKLLMVWSHYFNENTFHPFAVLYGSSFKNMTIRKSTWYTITIFSCMLISPYFGRLMENLRKRMNFEVVISRRIALKRITKPNLKRAKLFREDLFDIHMTKPVFVLNPPIQLGFVILDLSKYLIYDFHYNP